MNHTILEKREIRDVSFKNDKKKILVLKMKTLRTRLILRKASLLKTWANVLGILGLVALMFWGSLFI
ncbi:MAG: hypothetical protein ACRC41_11175 [Sarcina sp.]